MLKTILKFLLYAGAVASCLAGLGAIYVAIDNFRQFPDWDPDWPYEVALTALYASLAFTPAFMFLTGLKTKTWQWVLIGIAEVIVVGLAAFVLFAIIGMALSNPG